MKKKKIFVGVLILQIIFNVISIFNIDSLAKEYLTSFKNEFKMLYPELFTNYGELFTLDFAKNIVMYSSGVCILLGIALLVMALNNRLINKKGLSIFLFVLLLLITIDTAAALVTIVGFGLLIFTKKEDNDKLNNIKEKKEIKKLDKINITKKDLLLSILLIFVYSSQFFIGGLVERFGISIVISYYVISFIACIYVFKDRLKRDFGVLKGDFITYIKYIFKMWGLMILASLASAMLVMLLNGNTTSVNQETLNTLPLWFMIPMACIWAPVVEESLFRGVIRRFISNDILFIIVSGISFGLLHTIGQEATLYLTIVQSLQYMAMGMVMAYTYVRSNNILTNMGVHCVQNTFSTIVLNLIK